MYRLINTACLYIAVTHFILWGVYDELRNISL